MQTLNDLKKKAKRAYPKGLDGHYKAYKVDGFEGYLLLDECTEGHVPRVYYSGRKWREDTVMVSA